MCDSRPSDTIHNPTLDKERALDWLTALLPALLFSIFYYRWEAVVLELLAIAGYLTAARLLADTGAIQPRLAPAAMTGLLVAFCLSATTPLWPAALAGAVAALIAAIPGLLQKKWPAAPFSQPILQPVLAGYLAVRLLFPTTMDDFTMPAQWSGVDGLSTATPLAALGSDKVTTTIQHLLLGIHAGAIGEGCAVALVLGALFLLIRGRLRLIAPASMLATLFLLSWAVWGMPLYSVLAGGAVLGALLLADKAYTTHAPGQQAVMGVVAGAVIVLLRRFAATDGTAVAVVIAGLLQPALPHAFRGCRWVGRKLLVPLGAIIGRGGRWLGRKLSPLGAPLAKGWHRLTEYGQAAIQKAGEIFRKKEK